MSDAQDRPDGTPQYPSYPGASSGGNQPPPPPGYGQAPQHGQVPPQYGQTPNYGQAPQYGAPQYGTPQYGQVPPPGSYGYGLPPKHPSATTAMVLGIVALAGGFLCYLPAFIGPFAWWQGRKVMREIDAEPARWSGRGEAKAGMILGIISTVLLVLLLALVALLVVLTITVEDFWESSYEPDYTSVSILRSVLAL